MLTPERIAELNCIDIDRLDYEVFEINKDSVKEFARAIEAEVRKQDEALIRQMLDAMQKPMKAWSGTCAWHGPLREAIAAANKRLNP